MRWAVATFSLFALFGLSVSAAAARDITLALPHQLRAGETAWLEVRVGAIRRGQEIDVTTSAGRELGVISPFGVRFGHEAGTYTLPVPHDAFRNGRIAVRLTTSEPGAHRRPVTAKEVLGVRLIVSHSPH
jgi:hypothetical protein